MMKILSYIILLLGAISIILSFEQTKNIIPISLPEQFTPTILTIIGGALILLGLFLLSKGGRKSNQKGGHEVPVYEGDKIVAYRRV